MKARGKLRTIILAVASGAAVIAVTACGSTSSSSSTASSSGTTASLAATATSCPSAPDTSLDATLGSGAGAWAQDIACAQSKPLKASGTPIKIGLTNANGDPSFSFPDYTDGVEAAVSYVNDDLGGVGGDPATGKAGRPIQLVSCALLPTAASDKSCAAQIASAKPYVSIDGLDEFGDEIYSTEIQSGVVPFSGWPSIDANTKNPQVFAIVPGGAGVGLVAGAVDYAVSNVHAKKIAVEIDDNPGGLALYSSIVDPAAAANPSVKFTKVLVPQGTSAWSSLASQILGSKPDAILGVMAPAECWDTVNALAAQGWTSSSAPFVMTSTCKVQPSVVSAGTKAVGVTFVGANDTASPQLYSGLTKTQLETYLAQYKKVTTSVPPDAFSGAGFQAIMAVDETVGNYLAQHNAAWSPTGFSAYMRQTKDLAQWGDVPWGCASAPKGFASICAVDVSSIQWNGSSYKQVNPASDPLTALGL